MQRQSQAIFLMMILLASLIIIPTETKADESESDNSWDPLWQPWAQYGRDAGHSRVIPEHGDTGLATIETPAVNWVAFDSGLGADGYGVAIANLSKSITSSEGAKERCGEGKLFAIMTHTDPSTSDRHLSIIEGDSAKVVWEVNLGEARYIRSTPVLVDVDGDEKTEIAIAYDTSSALKVDLWSPELTCDESGWMSSGHSNERLWSWTDADLRLGINSPHFFSSQSNHFSVTQPLLADLSLDGSPELVLATVDTSTDDPTVIALPLGLQSPEVDWSVALDRGTHPSDPAFANLDDNSGSVVLTTVDSNSGNMWIWQIDGPTGSLDWERVSIQNTDSDSDTPRLRLPGPVITQLDSDAPPEMILTLPVDENGANDGMGAQYVGMELTSTNEIWRFRAKNGYGDAEPLPMDTTGDGVTDRVCWVTWYSDSSFSTDREGMTGCHDITIDPPFREWSRTLQRGSGNDNDEIAVAAPIALDLDGEDEEELIVAFGRRLFAFDGDTGTSADVSTGWAAPVDVPHRTWAGPAVADMDGDGHLDILIGDALISEAKSDVAPLADGRGIGFTPPDPDPGEMVTISCQYSNIGIVDTDAPTTAILMMNGVEIERYRQNIVESVAPSGEGGPVSFSVDIEATLGVHTIELFLDTSDNLTQTRTENDYYSTTLTVLEPYVAEIQTPMEVSRALPGSSQIVDVTVMSTGSRAADWTLDFDDSVLPQGWKFEPIDSSDLVINLERDVPQIIQFNFSVPIGAEGSDNAYVPLNLSLNQDGSIFTNVILPLEVERTRGLSLQGATGLPNGIGFGKPGDVAHVWILVENVGNAQETTEMQWSSNTWSTNAQVVDYEGNTQWSIELNPSEKKEYLIEVDVPIGETLGESTSSTLTLCIGSGDDEICEDFTAVIFASDISTDIPHIRTIPSTNLTWDIQSNYDGSTIVWDMSEASMLKEGWSWYTSGDLMINGTNLEMNGQNGKLHLDLPMDAQPKRHFFNQSANNLSDSSLSISLHVLQVFRANAEVVDPLNDSTFNVSERTRLILKLENPGNGEDTFLIEGFTTSGNLTEKPEVLFEISNPTRTIGAGGLSNVPVWVTLPDDVPAKEKFELVFKWTSMGDSTVYDYANITIQARPDHRWDVNFDDGEIVFGTPGEELELGMTVVNTGNSDDLLTIEPSLSINYQNGDSSVWNVVGINSSRLDVNQSQTMSMSLSVPEDAWAGTTVNLTIHLFSGDFAINQTEYIIIEVSSVSGWRIDLANTVLEVPPEGGEIEITIQQKGNSPAAPYISNAGGGWNTSIPTSGLVGNTVNPGTSTVVNFSIYPPDDAVAGEIGILEIRVRNGDGSGAVTQQVPIRVGAAPGLLIDSKGAWLVKQDVYSMPTTWLENIGNEMAIVNVSIPNLPTDWNVSGEGIMLIAPNEIKGLPLLLQPAANWNSANIQLDIHIEHPTLGLTVYDMVVSESDNVLLSSPVHTGRTGEKVTIDLNTPDGIESSLIELPSSRSNVTHNGVILHLIGIPAPVHQSSCSTDVGSLSELGVKPLSMVWTSCTITAHPDYDLVANAWIKSQSGEILSYEVIRISAGQNKTTNLSVSNWDPNPGFVTVDVLIIDSNGIELYSKQTTHIARQSGWNVKLSNLEVNDEYIEFGVDRNNYQIMEGSICRVDISASEGDWSTSVMVDIYGGKYPPSETIDRPDEIEDATAVTAKVVCNAPWDIDDNPSDDSMTVYASTKPLVSYSSGDIYWTLGIGAILVIIAYFGGVLNLNNSLRRDKEKDDVNMSQAVNRLPENNDVEMKIEPITEVKDEFEDISFEEESEEEDAEEEVTITEIEQEVVDIDDDTASGRLSALRREIQTDGGQNEQKDDIGRRMDSFFKNR